MAEQVIVNKQLSLNWRDVLKGGVVAAISPVFTIIIQSLQAGDLAFNWKSIANVAIISFLTYISKNFFANPSVVTTYSDNQKATEVAKEIKS